MQTHLSITLLKQETFELKLNFHREECLNRNISFATLQTKGSFAAAAKLMLNLHMFCKW